MQHNTVETLQFAVSGDTPLLADLYRPSEVQNLPAIIAVSGGGWLRGTRTMLADWGMYLASQGYAVLAIDYRQSTVGPSYPENVRNVHAACDFLLDNAASLGVDPDRIGLLGVSSGAHLASLAAFTQSPRKINALVLVYGIFDLVSHWQFETEKLTPDAIPLTERMIGSSPSEGLDEYRQASPFNLVGIECASKLDVMLIWGHDDDVVSPKQSEAFAEALSRAGAEVLTVPVSGAGHFWFSKQSVSDAGSKCAEIAPPLLEFLALKL